MGRLGTAPKEHSGAYVFFVFMWAVCPVPSPRDHHHSLVQVGEHEGDWEHVTVRCTKEGQLLAVYYGSHRHGDGTWVRAEVVPFETRTGRIVAFVARNGHGTYPAAATYGRIFGLANDVTSADGPVWAPRRCIAVFRPSGEASSPSQQHSAPAAQQALPVFSARGGRPMRPAPQGVARKTVHLKWPDSPFSKAPGMEGAGAGSNADVEGGAQRAEATAEFAPWLEWRLRWGTQLAPQQQEWFQRPEHQKGSSCFKRALLPCVRG
jgi:hypothetical protein